jgi:methyltransferase
MLEQTLGLPQMAALLVLAQRGLEELYSQFNTRALLRKGAYEVGREYYPVVAVTHLCWIAGIALFASTQPPVYSVPLVAFFILQVLRYWIIAALGPYWTHRIIVLPGAPVVKRGPYRFLRHPNYAVTLAETLLLPLAFGEVALAVVFTIIWAVVLRYKIILEDAGLEVRRTQGAIQPCH